MRHTIIVLLLSAIGLWASEPGLIRITTNGLAPQHLKIYAGHGIKFKNETPSVQEFYVQGIHVWLAASGGSFARNFFGEQSGGCTYEVITNNPSFRGTITAMAWPYPDLKLTGSTRLKLPPGTHNYRNIEMETQCRLLLSGDTTIIAWGPYFGDPEGEAFMPGGTTSTLYFEGNGKNGASGMDGTDADTNGGNGYAGSSGEMGGNGCNLTVIAHGGIMIGGSLSGGNGGGGGDGGGGGSSKDGPPGDGGNGGSGGHGGNGGSLRIFSSGAVGIEQISASGGNGGQAGKRGNPGLSDQPGPNGGLWMGRYGAEGSQGNGGEGGAIEIHAAGVAGNRWEIPADDIRAWGGIGEFGGRGGRIRLFTPGNITGYYELRGGQSGGGRSGAPSTGGDPKGYSGSPGFTGGQGGVFDAVAAQFMGFVDVMGGQGGAGGSGSESSNGPGGVGASGGNGGSGGNVLVQSLAFDLTHPLFAVEGGSGGAGGHSANGRLVTTWDETEVKEVMIGGELVKVTNTVHHVEVDPIPAQPDGAEGLPGPPGSISTNKLPSPLAVDLFVDKGHAAPGDELRYVVTPRAFANLEDVEIAVPVPPRTTFVSANGSYDPIKNQVKWAFRGWENGIALGHVVVRVNDDAAQGLRIENQATARSSIIAEPANSERVVTLIDDGLVLYTQAYEILDTGEVKGPISSTIPGTLVQWKIMAQNRFSGALSLESLSAGSITFSEIQEGSLRPAGIVQDQSVQWNQPVTLPGLSGKIFSFKAKINDPMPNGEKIVSLSGGKAILNQSGQRITKPVPDTFLVVRPEVLTVQAIPTTVQADGTSAATLIATLMRGNQPLSFKNLRLTSTAGRVQKATNDTSSPYTYSTGANGQAKAVLISEKTPCQAIATAEWEDLTASAELEFAQFQLSLECNEVQYTRVPHPHFGMTTTVKKPVSQQPIVTKYGRSEFSVRLRFTGPADASELANKVVELSSLEKIMFGADYIDFPDQVTTDARGESVFNVGVEDLWRLSTPPAEINIAAILHENSSVVGNLDIVVFDNAAAILDLYLQVIPVGPIWGNVILEQQGLLGAIIDTHKWMVMRTSMAGHINNALASGLFKWAPNNWDDQFNAFTCGDYQNRVLSLLGDLHFNREIEFVQTDYLLNGLDYGPLFENGGLHVAAMMYPRKTDGHWEWWDNDTWILDPWLEQKPRYYTWTEWMDRLKSKNFTIDLDLPILPWSIGMVGSGSLYNSSYPANGLDYPINPIEMGGAQAFQAEQVVMVSCPVNVTIEDEQGRKSGYDPSVAEGKYPVVDNIPGVRRSLIALPDGTSSWFFELPAGKFKITIQAYTNGVMDLTVLSQYHSLRFEQVALGNLQSGILQLDSANSTTPILNLVNGPAIQPMVAQYPAVLTTARSGETLVLTWPAEYADYHLQSATRLQSTWRDWATATNRAEIPLTVPQRYFRLVKP